MSTEESTDVESKSIKIEPFEISNSNLKIKMDSLESNLNILMELSKNQENLLKSTQSEISRLSKIVLKFCETEKIVSQSSMNNFQVYVGNLTTSTTVPILKSHFEKFGSVVNAVILRKHLTSQNGFVHFKEASTVDEVLAQSHVLDGRSIIVSKSYGRRRYFDKENLAPLCQGSAKNKRFSPY